MGIVRYPAGRIQARHAHPQTSVTLVLRGEVEETVGRRTERASALSVVVKPGGTEHADAFGPHGATTLQVVLSPDDEARLRLSEVGGVERWCWTHDGRAARALLRLRPRSTPEVRAELPDPDEEGLLWEVFASLAMPASPRPAHPPRWLERVRQALVECSEPIRDLAAGAGVHPVHLAREFRRHYGTAPSDFRRRARVRRAAAMFPVRRLTLAEIACAAGFADQAHMTRDLRSVVGITPGDYRRLVETP